MDKKRAKEIAILEWESIVEYMQQKGSLPAGRDISLIKETVVCSLRKDGCITVEELHEVQEHHSCALCAFFDPQGGNDCTGCPLSMDAHVAFCEVPEQPYGLLFHKGNNLPEAEYLKAAQDILQRIKAWVVTGKEDI